MYKLLYIASLADCYGLITPCCVFLQVLMNTPDKLAICKCCPRSNYFGKKLVDLLNAITSLVQHRAVPCIDVIRAYGKL
jgi:hypothetical protein